MSSRINTVTVSVPGIQGPAGAFTAQEGSASMIYGVKWDSVADTMASGTVNSAGTFEVSDYQTFPIQEQMIRGLLTNAEVWSALNPYDANYDENGNSATLNGAAGQVMVRIPRFYQLIKRSAGDVYFLVSLQNFSYDGTDAWVPYGFQDAAYRYCGAFEGVAYSDAVNAACKSIVKDTSGYNQNSYPEPFTNRTRAQFRTQCSDGVFHQYDWGLHEILLILYLTEFKTWDSQSALPGHTGVHGWSYCFTKTAGQTLELGNFSGSIWSTEKISSVTVDGADDASAFSIGETVTGGTSGATGVVAEISGTTGGILYLTSVSGSFSTGETLTGGTSSATAAESSTSSTDGRYIANSFRGIENIFGNVWKWIDGININNPTNSNMLVYVCFDSSNFDDDTTTNYTDTTLALGFEDTDDFIKDITGTGALAPFFPAELGGGADSTSHIRDKMWNNAGGWRVVKSGGASSHGVAAGFACLDANSDSGGSYSVIGARTAA